MLFMLAIVFVYLYKHICQQMENDMTPEKKAARAREKFLNSLVSIAHKVKVITPCSTHMLSDVSVLVADNVILKGMLRDVNPMLEKLGFRPVRLTSNMLNPNSEYFAIDINTPTYCDPGCESYHSM